MILRLRMDRPHDCFNLLVVHTRGRCQCVTLLIFVEVGGGFSKDDLIDTMYFGLDYTIKWLVDWFSSEKNKQFGSAMTTAIKAAYLSLLGFNCVELFLAYF